uniref:Uncharacterized protein n=1 Tax=Arundo donax TaxID=35708 RepID=A0A0A8XZ04_ARUDO
MCVAVCSVSRDCV